MVDVNVGHDPRRGLGSNVSPSSHGSPKSNWRILKVCQQHFRRLEALKVWTKPPPSLISNQRQSFNYTNRPKFLYGMMLVRRLRPSQPPSHWRQWGQARASPLSPVRYLTVSGERDLKSPTPAPDSQQQRPRSNKAETQKKKPLSKRPTVGGVLWLRDIFAADPEFAMAEARRPHHRTQPHHRPPSEQVVRGSYIDPLDRHHGDDGPSRPSDTADGKMEQKGEPAVLVLSAASPSLLPSDFYRLAPKGQHMEGWASGIARVVQARDNDTKEPLGQFLLFFDNHDAARAYSEELLKRHYASRRALLPVDVSGKLFPIRGPLQSVLGSSKPEDAQSKAVTAATNPPIQTLFADPLSDDDQRLFTILPPDTPIYFTIHALSKMRLLTEEHARQQRHIGLPEYLLDYLKDPTFEPDHPHRVLLTLERGAIPFQALLRVINKDNKELGVRFDILITTEDQKEEAKAQENPNPNNPIHDPGHPSSSQTQSNITTTTPAPNPCSSPKTGIKQQQQQQQQQPPVPPTKKSPTYPIIASKRDMRDVPPNLTERDDDDDDLNDNEQDEQRRRHHRDHLHRHEDRGSVAFSRFVFAFPTADQATRFARLWNGRRIVDSETGRAVPVPMGTRTTLLW